MTEEPFSDPGALLKAMAAAPALSLNILPPGTPLSPGHVVGDHVLVEPLGSGGFANVWRARRGDGSEAAIKILHEHVCFQRGLVAGFEQEIWTLARLNHPGIVDIFSHGQTLGQKRPYYAMELLSGSVMKLRGVSLRRALLLMESFLEVLAHIHARGLIHRDLKPDNVFVLDHPGSAQLLKLMDFGISYASKRLSRDLPSQEANAGTEGMLIGTVTHMAPEQALGNHRASGPATDLYALGVILYEALAGQLPFTGSSPLQFAIHHVKTEVPRLNLHSPLDALEALVLRLLTKTYRQRYECAADVLRDLRMVLQSFPGEGPELPLLEGEADEEGAHTLFAGETVVEADFSASGTRTVAVDHERASRRQVVPESGGEAPLARTSWELRRVQEMPLVGREPVCEALLEGISRVRGAKPACEIILGGRGMGGQRLAQWLVHTSLERGAARVFHLDVVTRQELPAAMHQGIYRALRQPYEEPHFVKERILEDLGWEGEEAEELTAFLCDQLGHDRIERDESRLIRALWPLWGRVLARMMCFPEPRPLIFWVDVQDTQDIAPVAYFALWLLNEAVREKWPLMIVWPVIPGGRDKRSEEALQTLMYAQQTRVHRLEMLDEAQCTGFLRALEPDLDPGSAARFVERCEGNPQWLGEALFEGWSSGALQRVGESVLLVTEELPPLPVDLLEVLKCRMERFWEQADDPEKAARAWKLLAVLGATFSRDQVEACMEGTPWTPEVLVELSWLKPQEMFRRERYSFRDQDLRRVLLGLMRDEELGEELSPVALSLRLLESLRALGKSDWESANHELHVAINILAEDPPEDLARWRLWVLDAVARVAHRQRQGVALRGFANLLRLKAAEEGALEEDYRAASSLWLGCAELLDGKLQSATVHLEDACARLGASTSILSAHAQLYMAEISIRSREFFDAHQSLRGALVRLEKLARVVGSNPLDVYLLRLARVSMADARRSVGELLQQERKYEASRPVLEDALRVYTEEEDLQGQARAHTLLTRLWRVVYAEDASRRDAREAALLHLRCIEDLMERLEDPRGQALKAWEAASIAEVEGDISTALLFYQQAHMYYHECGEFFDEGLVCNVLGELYRKLGDRASLERALVFFERFREAMADAPVYEAVALGSIGWTLLSLGDVRGARTHFEKALENLQSDDGQQGEPVLVASVGAGGSAGLEGDFEGAQEHLQKALAMSGLQNIHAEEGPDMKKVLGSLLALLPEGRSPVRFLVERLLGLLSG